MLNKIYLAVVVAALVGLSAEPLLAVLTIAIALGVMCWRYTLWKRRNPSEVERLRGAASDE